MKYRHAVVMGGGFSGMLAAYVLSHQFEQVTLLERDNLAATAQRKGIPQADHLHVLMLHGQQVLDSLMPGILSSTGERLLPIIDWANDTKWYGPFGAYPQYPSDVTTLVFSRMWLDRRMYQRLLTQKNITILQGKAQQLQIQARRVYAVQFTDTDQLTQQLAADLLVDARGRQANTSECLTQAGFTVLPPRVIKTGLGYASRLYRQKQAYTANFKQIYSQVRIGACTRGVVISPVENQLLMVTALGLDQDKPPRAEADFSQFIADLPLPEAHEFLAAFEPAGPVNVYRNLYNCHYRFGKMKTWPNGLIVIGDGVCLLNPVYGQGMTLAAMQVLLLKEKLRMASNGWEQGFQQRVDKLTFLPWCMATAEDQRGTGTVAVPIHLRCVHWYLDTILQLAVKRQAIHHVFIKILHMIKHPAHLLHPRLVWHVLIHAFSSRRL